MAEKMSLEQLDPKFKKNVRDKIRSVLVEIKCPNCSKTISKMSIQNISDRQTYTCKSKDCGGSVQADMKKISDILREVDRM